jgi:hypothetical protein
LQHYSTQCCDPLPILDCWWKSMDDLSSKVAMLSLLHESARVWNFGAWLAERGRLSRRINYWRNCLR